MILKLKQTVRTLGSNGFFSIFSTTVVNSVVSFIYGIFVVRMLSKADYASFSYAQNIANFAIMFAPLGMNIGVLQFCSEEDIGKGQKYGYCSYAARVAAVSSVFASLLMFLYAAFDASSISNLLQLMLGFALIPPLAALKEMLAANLRWQLRNREYARMINTHTILNAALAIGGAALFGIYGIIIGLNLAYIASCAVGLYYNRDIMDGIRREKSRLAKADRLDMLRFSVVMCIVNALIAMLFTVDLFIIGNVVKNADDIANFKTASTIPFALNMIPNAVFTFLFPYVSRHKNDSAWLKRNIKKIYLANGALNLTIGILLYIFAPLIISILFGQRYADILPIFRILTISYVANACLRTPSANLLGMLKMPKTAMAISVFTVALSIGMGIVLATSYGIYGSAINSVLTFSTVGIVSFAIIMWRVYRKKPTPEEPASADKTV